MHERCASVWVDHFRHANPGLASHLVNGRVVCHAFVIEPQAKGCRLRHEETFGGLLVPAFGTMLDDTARSFADLNAALKRRVEG